jgi:uncharacterized membrane protein YebE (DUF533 family)
MNRKLVALASVALMLGVASASFASTATPRVHRRQVRQQERIARGDRSGQLTPRETAQLERGQAHVQAMKERAKADGTVTPAERARLAHAQNVQSRRIYRDKHNRRHD